MKGVDARRLRAALDALSTARLGEDPAEAITEVVHELVGPEKTYAHGFRPHAAHLTLDFNHIRGFPVERYRRAFNDMLAGQTVSFEVFNPMRAERSQRNVVLNHREVAAITPGHAQVYDKLYPQLEARGHETVRLLVCDGPRLLGCIGLIQPERFRPGQRAVFQRLSPAIHRRLVFARALSNSALTGAALDVVLEHVPSAAYLLDGAGRVVYANTAGHARLATSRDVSTNLREHAAGRSPSEGLRLLRLGSGAPGAALAIEQTSRSASAAAAFARRARLTPAQARVLALVARGMSNRDISGELGVAERTIEAHVTAILDKADVASRAALIAKLFRSA